MQNNLTISLDIMGGDYGPRSTIPAAVDAVNIYSELTLILCGNSQLIQTELNKLDALSHPRLLIEHAEQVVNMDEKPAFALRSKTDSSMRVALNLVEQGRAQACVSSGNTGALFAMAYYVLKTLSGVKRPALITSLPTTTKKPVYLLDLGANISCCSETLFQFAFMGSTMVEHVEDIEQPRVALLNIGEEEIKGNDKIKATAKMLSNAEHINYVGYIEGSDIFSGKADVVVCEGFVGNVALKTCEGISNLIITKIKRAMQKSVASRILAFVLLPALKKLYKRVNPDQYNGASLIGLRGIVIKSHGNASRSAFLSAIDEAVREVKRQIPEKISNKLEHALITEK
ncbi:phosphate acyltransferase PlsX [Flocculibacter collagenilyticus]|uniref:phosphate acyltransferase PlsX n=1 Tax=Flocculibacter collagenilyticus TaxID=2744479 RepID=UPI0018F4013B|nr:phosphate acyltransferase PlsX [Flocculibacter collagenilyticus]